MASSRTTSSNVLSTAPSPGDVWPETESFELPSDLAVVTRSTRVAYETMAFAARHSAAPILILGPSGSGRRRLAELAMTVSQKCGQVVNLEPVNLVRGAAGAAHTLMGLLSEAGSFTYDPPRGVLLHDVAQLSQSDQWELCRLLDQEARASKRRLRFFATAGGDVSDIDPDLQCRLGVWSVQLEPLTQRHGDVQRAVTLGLSRRQAELRPFTVIPEAVELFLHFATSARAPWPHNFVELSNSLERLATFARVHGELSAGIVRNEILHLTACWEQRDPSRSRVERVLGDGAQELDRVDRAALEEVFSVCSATSSMAEAGKLLFARSRERRSSTNDSDRVKKYLTRYGLTWAQVQRKLVGR